MAKPLADIEECRNDLKCAAKELISAFEDKKRADNEFVHCTLQLRNALSPGGFDSDGRTLGDIRFKLPVVSGEYVIRSRDGSSGEIIIERIDTL